MRVISFVPSLSETLEAAGVHLVGRTRFCIHNTKEIAVVGGTKDINWNKVADLKPDLLLFDKEENPKSFAEASRYPWVATHIDSVNTCGQELERLSILLQNTKLLDMATRYKNLKAKKINLDLICNWVNKETYTHIQYIIWKDPLMAVSRNTFIGDVLSYLGLEIAIHQDKYPKLTTFDKDTLYLFSSEPYPFTKKTEWIRSLQLPAAVVDGENFSWFGIRSLTFLEKMCKF